MGSVSLFACSNRHLLMARAPWAAWAVVAALLSGLESTVRASKVEEGFSTRVLPAPAAAVMVRAPARMRRCQRHQAAGAQLADQWTPIPPGPCRDMSLSPRLRRSSTTRCKKTAQWSRRGATPPATSRYVHYMTAGTCHRGIADRWAARGRRTRWSSTASASWCPRRQTRGAGSTTAAFRTCGSTCALRRAETRRRSPRSRCDALPLDSRHV